MAHINLPEGLPGIRGPMALRLETSKPLNELAEVLLRSNNTLTRGERELIATYVSYLNDCFFCQNAHGALAQHYLGCDIEQMDKMKINPEATPISESSKHSSPLPLVYKKVENKLLLSRLKKQKG
ncbi:carboxymuconolactone decarboxylase family protein [Chryseosolibacter indicus]|uniref:carboxymuconolactone decarboxylase family protein n=1 Tax=Chryseosolibacter indicus TaxID=2782351 RepID=UPI0020B27154|nr:carboxymuconolactone decarboxylase family protein [Chryseosolibacter indicus]